jgi:hypothetical protein
MGPRRPRNGNMEMPKEGQIPNGTDDDDLLPCGCAHSAAFQQMMAAVRANSGPIFAPYSTRLLSTLFLSRPVVSLVIKTR